MSDKSLITKLPLPLGILIFSLLIVLPTLKFYIYANNPFKTVVSEISKAYKEQNIPEISYENFEARSNNDKVFEKVFITDKKESIHFIIDTSEEIDNSLIVKIKKSDLGIILFRDRMLFHDGKKRDKESVLLYKTIKWDLNFIINDDFIVKITEKFSSIIFLCILGVVFLYHSVGKLIQFLIISMFYSSKANKCGGGNYSVSLWSIVPPTLLQVLFPYFSKTACCYCGGYIVILIISAILFGKQLTPSISEE